MRPPVIVRLTRHPAGSDQTSELLRIFGVATAFPSGTVPEIRQVSETLSSDPREAVTQFDTIVQEAQIAEVVLPPNLLEAILKFSHFIHENGLLIRAVTRRTVHDDGSVSFVFSHYEQIKNVIVETERL